jgi:formylglycine-generating enzyme required for sulfatase activity/tRNA A-37 threonylcarbamoyl transferase component Bud32
VLSSVLLRCLARALVKSGVNVLTLGVGGDFLVDVWDGWKQQGDAAKRRADLEALAGASSGEVREACAAVVQAEAASLPAQEQQAVKDYLLQVPAAIRQRSRRLVDPSGKTVPDGLVPHGPDDLSAILPAKLPRFRPGDWPLPGVDLQLEELLGVGGFGEVWRASNPHLDRTPPVALKFCLDEKARERLLTHEMKVVNQVLSQGKHAGIVPLQRTYLRADPPCLEYEYVEGGDLAALLREAHEKGWATPDWVSRLVLRLAGIVAHAHAQGIVHRDLKPANVLVQRLASQGRESLESFTLRIADFGIGALASQQALDEAKRTTRSTANLPTMLQGTHSVLYASPQQVASQKPDVRDDVFALGVIWYQALTGNLGAPAPMGEGWKKRLREKGMPEAALAVLVECLEGEADDRLANAGELARRLEAVLQGGEQSKKVEVVEQVKRVELPPDPREIVNSIGMKFVRVPAGTFTMGSPAHEAERGDDEQAHEVEITRPFHLSVYPVTVGQWRAFTKATGYKTEAERGDGATGWTGSEWKQDWKYNWLSPGFAQFENHPVTCVGWNDAVAFCDWLTKTERGRTCRLPTEAEWEYSCRGGASSSPFHFGASLSSAQANFHGEYPYGWAPRGEYRQRTVPDHSFEPNGFGLYQMHGNVWEWCQDWHDENYYAASPRRDPPGPYRGTVRVYRGGGWRSSGMRCRSACRGRWVPSYRSSDLGFRVALVPSAG